MGLIVSDILFEISKSAVVLFSIHLQYFNNLTKRFVFVVSEACI